MDKYLIDNHKLKYHPKEITKWLDEELDYPIFIELSPHNICNHRCKFCSYSYTEFKGKSLKYHIITNLIDDMVEMGSKALYFAGEGEPLLHKDIADMMMYGKSKGLDISVATNGILLNEELARRIIPILTWMKFSVDGTNSKVYADLHQTKESDWDVLMRNIYNAVEIKKETNSKCTIGCQIVLFEESIEELEDLIKYLKYLEVDYVVIKPYSDHPYKKDKIDIYDYEKLFNKVKDLEKYSDSNFNVIIRENTLDRLLHDRKYNTCYAADFWCYIDSYGEVYQCSNFLGNKNYSYGNINKRRFKNIWKNKKPKEIDLNICRKVCRMDKCNEYLWGIKHPPDHVNFI